MSAPCVQCGTDSVATCPSCRARVCNRHMVVEANDRYLGANEGSRHVSLLHPVGASTMWVGGDDAPEFIDGNYAPAFFMHNEYANAFMTGGPRCLKCRGRDGATAAKATEQRLDEATGRLLQVEASLRAATDPAEIVRLILEGDEVRLNFRGGEGIPGSAYQVAWVHLVATGAISPSSELVEIEPGKGLFGRAREVRRPAWNEPGTWVWLDEAGVCWRRSQIGGPARYAVNPGVPVLERGRPRTSDPNLEAVLPDRGEHGMQRTSVHAMRSIISALHHTAR